MYKSSILERIMKLKIIKIIPIALTLIVIAVVLASLVTVIRMSFFSNGENSNKQVSDISQGALIETSAGSGVKMIVRGPIVADEDYKTYQIEITPNSRILSTTSGYMGVPVVVAKLNNNIPAYEQFVNALDKANLAKGVQPIGEDEDLPGICATGRIYTFQIISEFAVAKQLWTSTCSGSKGSLQASLSQVSNLFYAQIPDSSKEAKQLWR